MPFLDFIPNIAHLWALAGRKKYLAAIYSTLNIFGSMKPQGINFLCDSILVYGHSTYCSGARLEL